jgi:tetratricopeptide (TPR) repeat protein
MTPTPDSRPLSVGQLFDQYLARQIQNQAEGVGYPNLGDEAIPHEASAVQPIETAQAWKDGLMVLQFLSGQVNGLWKAPPEWGVLLAKQESFVAVPFAVGHSPQLVRKLDLLLQKESLLRVSNPRTPISCPALIEWAARAGEDQQLLAAAMFRMAGLLDKAERCLAQIPASPLQANELATLHWEAGRREEALRLWQSQGDSVPVRFNRGMANLMLGRAKDAIEDLRAAVAQLPETNAWHHLGSLYLTLAGA